MLRCTVYTIAVPDAGLESGLQLLLQQLNDLEVVTRPVQQRSDGQQENALAERDQPFHGYRV